MNTLKRLPAVVAFEWRRALTIPRLAWMVALAVFPPVLLAAVRYAAGRPLPPEGASILVFVLSPCVVCMMSVFLIATPAVSAELEGRSWVYLTVRPYGALSVLLGKYIVAVSWAIPIGLVSAVAATLVLAREDVARIAALECSLVCLSCMAYSAVFLLVGVIAPKRAMVFGVIYAVAFEFGAAFIPAAVNLLTVQHRLRCILVRGMDFNIEEVRNNPVFMLYFGEEGMSWHIVMLIVMTAAYITAAALLLRYREFTTAAESET